MSTKYVMNTYYRIFYLFFCKSDILLRTVSSKYYIRLTASDIIVTPAITDCYGKNMQRVNNFSRATER